MSVKITKRQLRDHDKAMGLIEAGRVLTHEERVFVFDHYIPNPGEVLVGKTYLTKGIASGLGIDERTVKSPTFTIMREYPLPDARFHHIDLYRFIGRENMVLPTIEEVLACPDALAVIEWATNIKQYLPDNRLDLHLVIGDKEGTRFIRALNEYGTD